VLPVKLVTLLAIHPSVVYYAEAAVPCILPKNCTKKQIGSGLWGIEWLRDRWRHVARKVKVVTPNTLRAQYIKNSWICYLAAIANY